MFKAQEIEPGIRLWPLLHGDLVLPRLTLRKPEIYLEHNAQNESNWSPHESPVANTAARQVQPQHRHQTPQIGRLDVIDGRVGYIDQKRNLDRTRSVSIATCQAARNTPSGIPRRCGPFSRRPV